MNQIQEKSPIRDSVDTMNVFGACPSPTTFSTQLVDERAIVTGGTGSLVVWRACPSLSHQWARLIMNDP